MVITPFHPLRPFLSHKILTKTLWCLPPKVHGIQTNCTFCCSHIQSHIEPMRNIMMHPFFQPPIELWEKEQAAKYYQSSTRNCAYFQIHCPCAGLEGSSCLKALICGCTRHGSGNFSILLKVCMSMCLKKYIARGSDSGIKLCTTDV